MVAETVFFPIIINDSPASSSRCCSCTHVEESNILSSRQTKKCQKGFGISLRPSLELQLQEQVQMLVLSPFFSLLRPSRARLTTCSFLVVLDMGWASGMGKCEGSTAGRLLLSKSLPGSQHLYFVPVILMGFRMFTYLEEPSLLHHRHLDRYQMRLITCTALELS